MNFLGGCPVASSSVPWPSNTRGPLSFLGQLELDELDVKQVAPWLPDHGRLLFFFELYEGDGCDPGGRDGWKVIYDPGHSTPHEIGFPKKLIEKNRLSRKKNLTGKLELSIPSPERVATEDLNLSVEEESEFHRLNEYSFRGNALHQLGGMPTPIQADSMEVQCHFESRGREMPDSFLWDPPEDDDDVQLSKEWKLLLQFDTDWDVD